MANEPKWTRDPDIWLLIAALALAGALTISALVHLTASPPPSGTASANGKGDLEQSL